MARVSAVLAGALASLSFAVPVRAATQGCEAFKSSMLRDSGDLKADFVRPLVVSRGAGSGLDSFDLVTIAKIDGGLRCQGDTFVNFEARSATPAVSELLERFAHVQRAASMAVLGWTPARAERSVREMEAEAADYLRASEERGDVSIAGKVEEHEAGGVDLGLIWTKTDRTFIVLRNE